MVQGPLPARGGPFWFEYLGRNQTRLLFLFFDLAAGLGLIALGLVAFGVAVANHVEAHEVGGAGFGASSCDDADDLARADVSLSLEDVFRHFDELVGVAEPLAEDGVGAPEKHAAVDDLLEGGEREDGWVGVVLGEETDCGSGLGEDGDGGYIQIIRCV